MFNHDSSLRFILWQDIIYLRDMLAMELDEPAADKRFEAEIFSALGNRFRRFDNTVHILKNG